MSPGSLLIIGCLLLSLIVTYAAWVRIRVWFLRQDLLVIREDLREAMRIEGQLNYPAYREFLVGIDALIEGAPALSAGVVGRGVRLSTASSASILGEEAEAFMESFLSPEPAPLLVRRANVLVAVRLFKYLVFETLTGWVAILRWEIFDDGGSDVSGQLAGKARNPREFPLTELLLANHKRPQAATSRP